jgi:hypothetical protein
VSDDYGSYSGSCGAPDYEIDPDGTEDYPFNLAADLDGDTISTVDFLLPDGLTEVSSSNTTTTATIFVSGAECGRTYRITCRYTTAGGRTRDKTIRVIGREQ